MEQKKRNQTTFMIALIALFFTAELVGCISPALARIGESFPEISRNQLQSLISIAAMASFLSSLVAGVIQNFLTQKTVILIGVFGEILGVIPLFYDKSFTLLLITAVFIGAGNGLMTATIPALISRHFDGDEKNRVMGLKTGFQGLGGMLSAFLGGIMATIAWRYNYALFFFALIAFFVALVFLPNTPVIKKSAPVTASAETAAPATEKGLPVASVTVILMLVLSMAITASASALANNMSLHTVGKGIGDSSVAGLALSFNSLGTIVAGFITNRVVKILKGYTTATGFAFMAIGLAMIFFLHFTVGVVLGGFVFGLGFGTLMTRMLFLLSSVLKPTAVPMGISLFSALTSLGYALAPYLLNAIAGIFSTPEDLATNCFVVACVIIVAIVVLLLVTNFEGKLLKKYVV